MRNIQSILFLSGIAFISILLMSSCAPPTESVTVKLTDVQFVFEPPIFEGPNSAQSTQSIGLTEGTIHSASIISATITPADSSSLESIDNFGLQITSSSLGLTQVGVLNPVSDPSQAILELSTEADATAAFKDDTFIIVLDATFNSDNWEESVTLTGDFVIQLNVKK